MTKELNQTIRSLKRSLTELNNVKIADYWIVGASVQGIELTFNEHRAEAIDHIEILICDLEKKYQESHKIGAHKL